MMAPGCSARASSSPRGWHLGGDLSSFELRICEVHTLGWLLFWFHKRYGGRMALREIYPGTPLVSTAFELIHPETDPIVGELRTALRKELASEFPLLRSHRNFTQTFEMGPNGPGGQTVVEEFPMFVNRSISMAVSFTSKSILVETTQYSGWESFKDVIQLVCEVRNSVSPIYGVERLGLRYIDEVRVGNVESHDWSEWIHPSLLGGEVGSTSGLPLKMWQGTLVYGSEPGHGLVLRYGPGEGHATDPNGELKRKQQTTPGHFFLLDIDSFWQPEDGVSPFQI